jgi:hypothetical protein
LCRQAERPAVKTSSVAVLIGTTYNTDLQFQAQTLGQEFDGALPPVKEDGRQANGRPKCVQAFVWRDMGKAAGQSLAAHLRRRVGSEQRPAMALQSAQRALRGLAQLSV